MHAEPMDYDIYARDEYYFGYSNADFKALMAALEDTVDPVRRSDLLQRIQRKIAADAVNGFLFQYPQLAVRNAHLQGLGFDNVLGVIDLKEAHYDQAAAAERARATAKPQSFRSVGWLAAVLVVVLMVAAARRFGVVFLSGRLAVSKCDRGS